MAKSVLITGCSDGGLGSALAIAFHKSGYRVIASARNTNKLNDVKAAGLETIQLDVLSQESIQRCVAELSTRLDGKLDIFVNNAGAGYVSAVVDIEPAKFRELLELNTLTLITTTQALLPLLRASASGGMIVNNTSILAVVTMAWQGAYSASKAAASAITQVLRLEMQPLGVKVVELRTGGVKTKFYSNTPIANSVPDGSVYAPAREVIVQKMSDMEKGVSSMTAEIWAAQVVRDLSKSSPSVYVWRGFSAQMSRWGQMLPSYFFDGMIGKMAGLDLVKQILAVGGKSG